MTTKPELKYKIVELGPVFVLDSSRSFQGTSNAQPQKVLFRPVDSVNDVSRTEVGVLRNTGRRRPK